MALPYRIPGRILPPPSYLHNGTPRVSTRKPTLYPCSKYCQLRPHQWLILTGDEHEATNVIAALADLPPDNHLVRTEFIEIKDTVLEMKVHGWADLFTMGPERNFHRVVLGYVNQVFQQISGINLITYYAATIYQQYIGLGATTARIIAAANGTE